MRWTRKALRAAGLACLLGAGAVACGAPPGSGSSGAHGTGATSTIGEAASVPARSSTAPAVPQLPGVTWVPVPTQAHGRPTAYTSHPDADTWLIWMDPTAMTFRFVPGTRYPEGSPVRRADRRPATWVPSMSVAFNGGFKLSDHVGGYYYAGRTVAPLRDGIASLVVGLDGRLRVLVWGRDLRSTAGLLAVRQNLPPLVDHGRSMTRPTDRLTTWGLPLHHRLRANRSALAELPDGSPVYVYVRDATPARLAQEAVRLHAVTAIALDMNSGWPAALIYQHTAHAVSSRRLSPVMHQHLNAYYGRPSKDFIVGMAKA